MKNTTLKFQKKEKEIAAATEKLKILEEQRDDLVVKRVGILEKHLLKNNISLSDIIDLIENSPEVSQKTFYEKEEMSDEMDFK